MDRRLSKEQACLERLAQTSHDAVTLAGASPDLRHFELTLRVPALVGSAEQSEVRTEHRLILDLSDDFPARGPIVRFADQVLAPNVYANGTVCIVSEAWRPELHLDQVVCDVIELIQGIDPNYDSVANPEAGRLFARPSFPAELRRRLGPPVRLAPLPAPVPSTGPRIATVGAAPAAGRSARPPASPAAPARAGIRTVRQ